MASFKNVVVANGDSEDSKAPSLVTAYGQFDELTLEFDKVLQPGRISPGLFEIREDATSYRVRKAAISKNSKEVILDLKDDLPAFTSSLTVDYIDLSGNQTKGVLQSPGGTDVASIVAEPILIFKELNVD